MLRHTGEQPFACIICGETFSRRDMRNRHMKVSQFLNSKEGRVFPLVVVSILPHAEFEPNDHREDAAHFTNRQNNLKPPLVRTHSLYKQTNPDVYRKMAQAPPDFLPIHLSHISDILVERNYFRQLRILGQLGIHKPEMIARTNEYDQQEPNQLCSSSKLIRYLRRIHRPL